MTPLRMETTALIEMDQDGRCLPSYLRRMLAIANSPNAEHTSPRSSNIQVS
jgi:hypothetical protein